MGPSRPDVEARLSELLREHGGLLRHAIWKVLPRHLGIQVEDVEQEARMRLWRALEGEREIRSPASYVYRAAVSAALDAVRRVRAAREDPQGLTEEMDVARQDGAGRHGTPEEQMKRAELAAALERAIGKLAPARERAVRLHLQGFGSQEMADLLGWSEPKARNLTYRGLDDLRRELSRMGITDAAS